MIRIRFLLLAFVIAACSWTRAEQTLSLKQVRDGAPAISLSGRELAELGDAFFNLVLKDHADVVALSQVENLLQPDASKRKLLVVDEHIVDRSPGSRRSVTIFQGSNQGKILNTNVMLSIFFSDGGFPESPTSSGAQRLVALEALGWDNHRGRYNYYKLDDSGTPTRTMTWKFRGSSEGADLLTPSDRHGTCMACHVNGAPLMKELFLPWNNWHSFKSLATYLTPTAPANQRWSVTSDPRLSRLQSAEHLEIPVMEGIRQFNTRRINAALKREDSTGNIELINGKQSVVEGRRLLRPLFETTEFNIISSTTLSGAHPLGDQGGGFSSNIQIPHAFFLNANLIGGGGSSGLKGLGLATARNFSTEANAVFLPDEYKNAVERTGLRILGRAGDANFAWLVPEPSFIDNNMVDQLIDRGIVPGQFAAAVMAIDLENPVLSDDRASLFQYIPETISFAPIQESERLDFARFRDHELTSAVIAAIEADSPAADSPAGKFLELLKASAEIDQPLKKLEAAIGDYVAEVQASLDSGDADARRIATDELMLKADAVRKAIINDEVLGNLDETGGFGLFPTR